MSENPHFNIPQNKMVQTFLAGALALETIIIGCEAPSKRAITPTPPAFVGPIRLIPTPAREINLRSDIVTIGPTEIATFKHGAIVNDTEDVFFDVFPEVLNQLSEDPDIGINAKDYSFAIGLHLVEDRIRTLRFLVAASYEKEQHPTGDYFFLSTTVDLVDVIRGTFGARRAITATDVTMSRDVNSELNHWLVNAFYIATKYRVSQPQPMVLPIEAQSKVRGLTAVEMTSAGNRFLTRVNNG